MIDKKKLLERTGSLIVRYFEGDARPFVALEDVYDFIVGEPQADKCSDCSRRKFYQQGYQDGFNANKWIPCEERLPDKECEMVLVCLSEGEIMVGYYTKNFGWYTQFCATVRLDIRAWQPLPQPYQEDKL